MTTNATIKQLQEAMENVNDKYDDNIIFKTINQISSGRVKFTLTVVNSSKPGSRISTSRTNKNGDPCRVSAACWHVHGDFFDALFNIDDSIFVRSMGKKIDINQGNWEDRNIGSYFQPMYYSEACDC